MRFALVGAAGFVAPRHMQAIKDVGGELVAVLDPHDSVGVLDRFGFHAAQLFTREDRFEAWLNEQRDAGRPIDWVSVCSPNFLHQYHAWMGLKAGANVICEKPLVTREGAIVSLKRAEEDTGKRVYSVLQLRHSPVLQQLRIAEQQKTGPHSRVQLTYKTPRGRWYQQSWKNDPQKSGGLLFNIGIHMLDLLIWIWGDAYDAHADDNGDSVSGLLRLGHADVVFDLSIASDNAPTRQLSINDGKPINFTEGFTDLHTVVYRETLAGRGHTIDDALPAIRLAQSLLS